MLTSKQRAKLRALASVEKPVGQVGKDGVTDAAVANFSDALEARELIKVTLLSPWKEEKRAVAEELASKLGAELVSVIGNRAIIYRRSQKDSHLEF